VAHNGAVGGGRRLSNDGSHGSNGGGKGSAASSASGHSSSGGGAASSASGASVSNASQKPLPSIANKIEEEIWVSAGSLALLVAGWRVLAALPPQHACMIGNTSGCLQGWPMIPLTTPVKAYYNAELGWYAHLMLKHALGLGLDDGSAMAYHHVATVALVVASYYLGVHGMGMLVFCLLNVSSPFLHASKLGNMLEMRRARVWLFMAFAAAYFVARLVLFPYVVVRVAVLNALQQVPGLTRYFLGYWVMFNVLLLALCGLQALWFGAIVRILRQALGGTDQGLAAVVEARDAARGLRDKRAGSAGAGPGGKASSRASSPALVAVVGGGKDGGSGGGGCDDDDAGGKLRGFSGNGGGGGARGGDAMANDQGFAGAAKHMIGRIVRFSSGGGGRGVIGTGPSAAERAMMAAAAAAAANGNGGGSNGHGHGRPGGAHAAGFERQPLLGSSSSLADVESQRGLQRARAGDDAPAGGGGGAAQQQQQQLSSGRAASLSAAGRRVVASADGQQPQQQQQQQVGYVR
jgi:hypothetical protein